jgi:hypothetical protein
MVRKRHRRGSLNGLTEYERGLLALENAPLSDEDPAEFWGSDWKAKLDKGDMDVAAGRIERFEGDDAFLRALMSLGAK